MRFIIKGSEGIEEWLEEKVESEGFCGVFCLFVFKMNKLEHAYSLAEKNLIEKKN